MPGGGPTGEERLLLKQVNLYRLHEYIDNFISGGLVGPQFVFEETLVLKLHGVVMERLLTSAGEYRQINVGITNTNHTPPLWQDVPRYMAEMAQYINRNWASKNLVELAAYVMWRLCWIHPFENGNGRTARGTAYLILCAKFGKLLPPKNSIIEQIMRDKQTLGGQAPYYKALREVDAAHENSAGTEPSCEPLVALLLSQLKEQLRANLT